MKSIKGIILFLVSTHVCFADLRVRTALKSGLTPTQNRVFASSFAEVGSTNLNYYPTPQGTSVQWMCGGLEVAAVNASGQLVNAEFRITSGSFTLYRNGTQFVKTNMSIFLPPSGGGTPSIAMYDKVGTRNATRDYQTIIGSITGARFVLSEHIFAIGATSPKFPMLDNTLGSSYVLGYSLSGDYKPEGESQFIPFTLLPGDHGFPQVTNTYRNYVAIVVGGSTREEWMRQLVQSNAMNQNGIRYVLQDPSFTAPFGGGHYLIGGETSVDLLYWTQLSLSNINSNTWVSAYFTGDPRRFFRSKVGTYTLFTEG